MMRSIFFGTPPIAVPSLQALARVSRVVGVVCQPDRPAGRGLTLAEPAVKVAARDLGIPVIQPLKVRTGELENWMREQAVDLALVIAYGRILPAGVLSAPRLGCVNLHASLLPAWRGAAPINHALIQGDGVTGITLMQMDEGMDTGPMLARQELPIPPDMNAGELTAALGDVAAQVVERELPRLFRGELTPVPQEHAGATHAPPITHEQCRIDWSRSAVQVVNLVRGLAPRPGAYTTHREKRLRILAATVAAPGARLEPGVVQPGPARTLLVGAGDGMAVSILEAQAEGRRALGAADLLNGRVLCAGDRLV